MSHLLAIIVKAVGRFFFKSSKLIVELLDFRSQAISLDTVLVRSLLSIRKFETEITYFIISLVKGTLLLKSKTLDELVVALLSFGTFLLEAFLKPRYLTKVLLLLQKDLVTFRV